MRIVGGDLSGRKIEPPLSRVTRPMMDRIRQALFNILEHRDWGQAGNLFADDAQILDAFCGTGALAFESLSRGAGRAVLFDRDREALTVAGANAASLGLKSRCAIQMADALAPPAAATPCRLIFLAPPYRKNLIPPALAALDQAGWLAPHAVLVAETARKEELTVEQDFDLAVERFYGDTALRFYRR